MLSISNHDRETAVRILTVSFSKNPGVLWVVKKDRHISKRIKALCKFCLSVAMQKHGAFITKDGKGVALLLKSWRTQNPFYWLTGYLQLGQYCIGWKRALSMINREWEITRRRPRQRHLYFWMLAIEDQTYGLSTIIGIRDFVFEYARALQLPIYAETTVEKNLALYLRYGFKLYDEWDTGQNGLKVYFISRDWDA